MKVNRSELNESNKSVTELAVIDTGGIDNIETAFEAYKAIKAEFDNAEKRLDQVKAYIKEYMLEVKQKELCISGVKAKLIDVPKWSYDAGKFIKKFPNEWPKVWAIDSSKVSALIKGGILAEKEVNKVREDVSNGSQLRFY